MVQLEINEEITEIPLSKVSFMVQLEMNGESTEMQMHSVPCSGGSRRTYRTNLLCDDWSECFGRVRGG